MDARASASSLGCAASLQPRAASLHCSSGTKGTTCGALPRTCFSLLPAPLFDLQTKTIFSLSVCVFAGGGGADPCTSCLRPRAIANSLQMVSVAVPGPGGGRAGEELGLDAASEMIVCRPVIQVADKAPLTLWRTRSGSVVNPGELAAAGVPWGWTRWDMALASGMCSGRLGARAAPLSTLIMPWL